MDTLEIILKKVERIERLLDNRPVKRTWVKAGVITDLTGWNNQKMREARVNGYIKFKKEEGKYFYLLESVPETFLKQTA